MRQRESVKLKESAKNTKKEPSNQHQSLHSMRLPALFATESVKQKLA